MTDVPLDCLAYLAHCIRLTYPFCKNVTCRGIRGLAKTDCGSCMKPLQLPVDYINKLVAIAYLQRGEEKMDSLVRFTLSPEHIHHNKDHPGWIRFDCCNCDSPKLRYLKSLVTDKGFTTCAGCDSQFQLPLDYLHKIAAVIYLKRD